MQMTRREIDGVLVLSFAQELDLEGEASREFREAIRRVIEDGRTNVVLDLGGVGFTDSSGLGALVTSLKLLREGGGSLRLANTAPQLRSILEITRLERVFERYETVEEAVRAALGECPAREGGAS